MKNTLDNRDYKSLLSRAIFISLSLVVITSHCYASGMKNPVRQSLDSVVSRGDNTTRMVRVGRISLDTATIYVDSSGTDMIFNDGSNTNVTLTSLVGGTSAPADATYITQTTNGTLTNEQALNSLSPGGVLSSDSGGVISAVTVQVGRGGTGLTSGTSGAIPFFSAAQTIASSSLLTANAVMLGGGSATAPLTITADTATTHALFSTATAPAFRQINTNDVAAGVFEVSRGGTNISSGNNGGIPYFNTTSSMASSATLTSSAVVIGGGSGATPKTITADTSTSHVLFSTATDPAFRQINTNDVAAGVFQVSRGGTNISSGNSGGIPYFNTTSSMSSSAALTSNAVVIGGGAGTTPSTITADTATIHFLGSTATSPAFRGIQSVDVSGTWPLASIQNDTSASWITKVTDETGTGSWVFATSPTLTTPRFVDLGSINDSNGNKLLSFNLAGSAVNFVQISNDVTGKNPTIQGNGTDANVGLILSAKGNGIISSDRAFVTRVVPLTDAATISTNAATGNIFSVTLGGNRILGNPSNPTPGQKAIWIISQDATGSRTLSYHSVFRFGSDITSPTLTTTAGSNDYIAAIYNIRGSAARAQSWDVVSVVLGYAS